MVAVVVVGLVTEMVVVAVGGAGGAHFEKEGRQTLIFMPPLVELVSGEIMVRQHFIYS